MRDLLYLEVKERLEILDRRDLQVCLKITDYRQVITYFYIANIGDDGLQGEDGNKGQIGEEGPQGTYIRTY